MQAPSAPILNLATGFRPRVRRTVYGLTDPKTGHWYLGTEDRRRKYSTDPIVALKHYMLWLTYEVAAARLRAASTTAGRRAFLTVTRVELELGPGGWEVVG